MGSYRVTDPATGKSFTLQGDSPPTESELEDVFKGVGGGTRPAPLKAPAPPPAPAGISDMLLAGLKGKGGTDPSVTGGLTDIFPPLKHPLDTLRDVYHGSQMLAKESASMEPGSGTRVLPGALEALIPGGPLALGMAKSAIMGGVSNFQKNRAAGVNLVSSALSGIPLLGPTVTGIAEDVGSGDPEKQASAAGSAVANLLPWALPKGTSALGKATGADAALQSGLKASAETRYARAMKPIPGEGAKFARGGAPALLEDGMLAKSVGSLHKQVVEKATASGQEVAKAVNRVGGVPVDPVPLVQRLRGLIAEHLDPDTGLPMSEAAGSTDAIAKVQAIIGDVTRKIQANPTVGGLYKLKKYWDERIRSVSKAATFGVADSSALKPLQDANNILRDELNAVKDPTVPAGAPGEFPLRDANEAYHHWADARDALDMTVEREAGRSIATKTPGSLASAGAHVGVPIGAYYALKYGLGVHVSPLVAPLMGLYTIIKLRNSTAWNTLSGAARSSLSEALSAGKVTPAAQGVLSTSLAASKAAPPAKKEKPSYFPTLKPPTPPPIQTPSGLIAEEVQ